MKCHSCGKEFYIASLGEYAYKIKHLMNTIWFCSYKCLRVSKCVVCGSVVKPKYNNTCSAKCYKRTQDKILQKLVDHGLDRIVLANFNKGIIMASDEGLRTLTRKEQVAITKSMHNVLHVIKSEVQGYDVLTMIIKSPYPEDESTELSLIDRGRASVYAHNLDHDHLSDMGTIGFIMTKGYMVRL